MEKDLQSKFFIVYPRDCQQEAMNVVDNINYRLGIDYPLWEYDSVDDTAGYFQEVAQPAIEEAMFVLAFIGKSSEEDYLLKQSVTLCQNLNKSLVPIKIGDGRVKDKNWGFRTRMVDYSEENQCITLIEQMHSWLGLTRVGDVYGSKVTIITDTPCTITRNGELLGSTLSKGLDGTNNTFCCTLAKGCQDLVVETRDGYWNRYRCVVSDNNGEIQYEASLKGVTQLAKNHYSLFLFNPDSGSIPRWDLTERNDFQLVGSSEDEKKRKVVVESYNNYYHSKLKPYPEFHPQEIIHRKWADVVCWVVAVAIGFFGFDDGGIETGVVLVFWFYVIRSIKDNIIRKLNERRRKDLITKTDNANQREWSSAVRRMNQELGLYKLSAESLPNLGTPSEYLDVVRYEFTQIG